MSYSKSHRNTRTDKNQQRNRESRKSRSPYQHKRQSQNTRDTRDTRDTKRHRNQIEDTNQRNETFIEGCLGKDWNPNNKLLDRTFVENIIERFCGTYIRIYDLRKYQLAFVHKSVKKRDISPPTEEVLSELAKAKVYKQPLEPILEKYSTWNNGEPVIFTQGLNTLTL